MPGIMTVAADGAKCPHCDHGEYDTVADGKQPKPDLVAICRGCGRSSKASSWFRTITTGPDAERLKIASRLARLDQAKLQAEEWVKEAEDQVEKAKRNLDGEMEGHSLGNTLRLFSRQHEAAQRRLVKARSELDAIQQDIRDCRHRLESIADQTAGSGHHASVE